VIWYNSVGVRVGGAYLNGVMAAPVFEHLINPAARETWGKIGLNSSSLPPSAGPGDVAPARRFVGMKDGQVAADLDTTAAQFVEGGGGGDGVSPSFLWLLATGASCSQIVAKAPVPALRSRWQDIIPSSVLLSAIAGQTSVDTQARRQTKCFAGSQNR
jgi:hypothetical protein